MKDGAGVGEVTSGLFAPSLNVAVEMYGGARIALSTMQASGDAQVPAPLAGRRFALWGLAFKAETDDIRESIGEGPDLLPQEMKPFEEAVFQLAALGRNLNQLLKLVHSGQVKAGSQELSLMEGIRTQVELLKKETLTVIDRSRERWVRHAA